MIGWTTPLTREANRIKELIVLAGGHEIEVLFRTWLEHEVVAPFANRYVVAFG